MNWPLVRAHGSLRESFPCATTCAHLPTHPDPSPVSSVQHPHSQISSQTPPSLCAFPQFSPVLTQCFHLVPEAPGNQKSPQHHLQPPAREAAVLPHSRGHFSPKIPFQSRTGSCKPHDGAFQRTRNTPRAIPPQPLEQQSSSTFSLLPLSSHQGLS